VIKGRAWLKGGLIAVIAILVLSLILWGILILIGANIVANPLFIFMIPGMMTLFIFIYDTNGPSIIVFIITFLISSIYYFIIGAIIGLIVGKIKQRKQQPPLEK